MTDDRWHHHFIQSALHHARMSKDPRTQVGAVIVGPDREIRSVGFNGLPRGMNDTPERLNDQAYCDRWIVHAERNAICNAARAGISLKGCTLYLAATDDTGKIWGGAPCTNCAAEVIQAGIVRTISYPFKNTTSRWAENVAEAQGGLEECGVFHIEVHQPTLKTPEPGVYGYRGERLVPRRGTVCNCFQHLTDRISELGQHHSIGCPNYTPF